jgi:uroporphyrinogen-III synthase
MSGRLQGLGVVVTRPRIAAEHLARALEREGARAFVFPALALEDIAPTAATRAALGLLPRAGLAIFVSANAAEKGLALARAQGPWPATIRVAAIGEATAEALRNSGLARVISPAGRHDSEALLALPELQAVKDENVIVFRGEGGRELLRQSLESRGARVHYVECYRRVRPAVDPSALLAAGARGEVQAVSVLSAETLENFVALVGAAAQPWLARSTLVVPHEAVGRNPEARRFARVVVAAAGAQGVVDALSPTQVPE